MAIGLVLGRVQANVVEATSCFAVPHEEGEGADVGVDEEYLTTMLELQQRVAGGKEQIVGWYCTTAGNSFSEKTPYLHDFVQGIMEGSDPVYLVVDAGLSDLKVGTNAYMGSALQLGGEALSAQFRQIHTDIVTTEHEKVGIDAMMKGIRNDRPHFINDLDSIEVSIRRLLEMLNTTADYVSGVVNGTVEANEAIGRQIAVALASVPRIDSESFGRIFNENLQDLLMVVYLSNLTRAQLAITDKMVVCEQMVKPQINGGRMNNIV